MDSIRWPAIVAVAIVAAFVVYLTLGRATPQRSAAPARVAPSAAMTVSRREASAPIAGAPPESAPAPRRPLGPPPAGDASAPDAAASQRSAPAATERMSRKDVRVLLERAFKGKLPDRELTNADYDRLVDDVMRLRSALRAMRHAEQSPNGAAATAERETVVAAMADVEAVTGVPPSELGTVLGADDDAAAAPSAPLVR